MEDVLKIKIEVDAAGIDKATANVESLTKAATKAAEAASQVSEEAGPRFRDKLKAGVAGIQELSRSMVEASEANQVFGEAAGTVTGALSVIQAAKGPTVAAFNAVSNSLKGTSVGFKTLTAAMAGTGVGLLVTALGALVSYLTSTREGSEKLSAILTGLSEGFGQITNVVQAWGKAMFEAISSPKQLVIDLGEAIKHNVENRIKALGEIVDAVINGSVTDAFRGVVKAVTGMDDAIGSVQNAIANGKELVKSVVDVTQDAAATALEISQLEGVMAEELAVKVAKYETQMAGLQAKIKDTTLSYQERMAAVIELDRLENESLQMQIAHQEKLAAAIAKSNSYTDTSAEAAKKQQDAEVELEQLRAKFFGLNENRQARLNELTEAANEAAQKQAETIAKINAAIDKLVQSTQEIQFELSIFDANKEAQELAKFDREFQKQLEAISNAKLEVEGATNAQIEQFEKAKQENLAALQARYERQRTKLAETLAKERAEAEFSEAVDGVNKQLEAQKLALTTALADGLISRAEYEARVTEITEAADRSRLELALKYGQETTALLQQEADKRVAALEENRQRELKGLEAVAEEAQYLVEQQVAWGVKTEYDAAVEKLEIQRKLIEDKLTLVEKGSAEEQELLKELVRTEDSIALARVARTKAAEEARIKAIEATVDKANSYVSAVEDLATKSLDTFNTFATLAMDAAINQATRAAEERTARINSALEEGLLSEEEAAAEIARIEAEKQAAITAEQRKAAEREKAINLASATMQTAQAVLNAYSSGVATPLIGPATGAIFAAIAAAFGAAQIAAIAATPLPSFAKGVLALDGPGTDTSDSILARLSRGESVMTARETRLFFPTLKAIRDGAITPEELNSFVSGKAEATAKVEVNIDQYGFHVLEYREGARIRHIDNKVTMSVRNVGVHY